MSTDPPSSGELHEAIDPGTLLPGEDPDSLFLEDAVHCVGVYGELLAMKAALLQVTPTTRCRP